MQQIPEITICPPRGKIYDNILQTIGGTPLVQLHKVIDHPKIPKTTRILVKCEYFNPMGSVKDRVGFNLVYQAILSGKLRPGMEILEATSGNTGIGLCQAAAVFGYPLTICMPESMSLERKKIIRAFGANLLLSPKEKGIPGAVELFNKTLAENPDKYFATMQFANIDNTEIHHTTAEEIWVDTNGEVDCVIAGVGTAGTVIGISEHLHKKNENIYMVAVEPEESQTLIGKEDKPHGIQGIGDGFIPGGCTGIADGLIAACDGLIATGGFAATGDGLIAVGCTC